MADIVSDLMQKCQQQETKIRQLEAERDGYIRVYDRLFLDRQQLRNLFRLANAAKRQARRGWEAASRHAEDLERQLSIADEHILIYRRERGERC